MLKPQFPSHSDHSIDHQSQHHHQHHQHHQHHHQQQQQQQHAEHSRFKSPEFDCNKDKLWFQKLKKFVTVMEDDLYTKVAKINRIRENGTHLKSRSSRLIFTEVEQKLSHIHKSMENFYTFLTEMNNLEIKYDAIVYDCDEIPSPRKLSNHELIHDSAATSESGAIDTGSFTDSMQNVGNAILNGISENDQIFSDFFSSPISASVASSISLTFATPKSKQKNVNSPLKTPRHGYDVVRDLLKEFTSPEKQMPSSPLASSSNTLTSDNIPSDVPVAPVLQYDFVVNETQSTTTSIMPQSTPSTKANSESSDCTYVVTQAKSSSVIASPASSETRKMFRSKRFNLDKFKNYNAMGLKKKRGRENNPEAAVMVTTIEKVADESNAVVARVETPKNSKSMTPQLLKTMNVDEFLSQVHQKLNY